MLELTTSMQEKETEHVKMVEGRVFLNGVKLNVYSFLIDGVLIDTGAQTLLEDFKPWFEKQKMDQIFLTHNHEDHTGGVTWIVKTKNIPVYIHKDSVETCRSLEETPLYRKLTWGSRGAFNALPFTAQMRSKNYTWDIIETPGHTQDHHSFYCQELKIIFTGDLFVLPHTKAILASENLQDTLSSLNRILDFDFEEIYCCHAGYLKNGREMIIEKINYLQQILQKSTELQQQGLNIEAITEVIFPKKYPIEQFSNGEWGSKYIVKSLLQDHITG